MRRLIRAEWRILRSTLLFLFAVGLVGEDGTGPRLLTWRLEKTGFQADPGASDAPLAVGSLQKPFIAKAWAFTHLGEPSPRVSCGPESHCWLHKGHGELGLSRALALSCNTYFLRLAEATPRGTLSLTMETEGFSGKSLTPESAIGLSRSVDPVTIRPSALLEAYFRLVKTPWPVGEAVRQEVLDGLKQAARDGTAILGQRGYLAKTGTVPDSQFTTGFALAVDHSGWAILARLSRGTGSQAAAALAGPLARLRPWGMAQPTTNRDGNPRPRSVLTDSRGTASGNGLVTVRLLDLLSPRQVQVTNAGSGPIPTGQGYLGPGGTMNLLPGNRIGPGLLDIQVPGLGLKRRLEGELSCGPGLRLIATLPLREYADGVVAAELPSAEAPRRIELGAAILRFLRTNHRHPDADVCDSTHCAWFIGRGPRLAWTSQGAQRLGTEPSRPLDDQEWTAIQEAAARPGPSQWSTHCGGTPLSPHTVWGSGDLEAAPCPRHGEGRTRSWVREWKNEEVAKAFGGAVGHLQVSHRHGVWRLQISTGAAVSLLSYDETHRALAKVLGWGALPSPADRVESTPEGFRAWGVGLGHRVGLCLGD